MSKEAVGFLDFWSYRKCAVLLFFAFIFRIEANDPCGDKKFCGNLTIIYNGAGENIEAGSADGVDPAATDTVDLLNNFSNKRFKNNKIMLFSSDQSRAVREAKEKSQKIMGANFVGHPAARPAFDQFLNNDTALNALKKSFASDPACDELMKAAELDPKDPQNVTRFLRVQIFVASHSQKIGRDFVGIPAWPTNNGKGLDTEHSILVAEEKSDNLLKVKRDTYLTSRDFALLRNHFRDSVMQATSFSCDGEQVGEMILPNDKDVCSCYSGLTGRDIVARRSAEQQSAVRFSFTAPSKSNEASLVKSLVDFTVPMLGNYRWGLVPSEPELAGIFNDPIFDFYKELENPFDAFAVTSVESSVSKVLKTAAGDNLDAPTITKVSLDKNSDRLYKEVLHLTEKLSESHKKYLEKQVAKPESLEDSRADAAKFLNSCIVEPDEGDKVCIEFSELLKKIHAKSATCKECREAYEAVLKVRADVKAYYQSPLLKGKNDNPMFYLGEFKKHSQNFKEFRSKFARAARIFDQAADTVAGLKRMGTALSTFHASYVNAYFPSIVKDTLNRRVENVLKAATHLKQGTAVGDHAAVDELQNLRNQLACSLNFSVGPNYKKISDPFSGDIAAARAHLKAEEAAAENKTNREEAFR